MLFEKNTSFTNDCEVEHKFRNFIVSKQEKDKCGLSKPANFVKRDFIVIFVAMGLCESDIIAVICMLLWASS